MVKKEVHNTLKSRKNTTALIDGQAQGMSYKLNEHLITSLHTHRSVNVSDKAKIILHVPTIAKKHTIWFGHNASSAQPARQVNENSRVNWASK